MLWATPLDVLAAKDTVHVIKKGDSLSRIARRYGTTVRELKRHNNLRSSLIKIGQKLSIPSSAAALATSGVHIVKRGDTLGGIASRHGTSIGAIKRANHLRSDLIKVGQELIIPDTHAPASGLLAPVIAATNNIRVDASRWRYIVCHHSAIEAGNAAVYGKAHLRRGMENGLAYHFVIGNGRDSGDGEIEIGPRWTKQLRGGHVRSSKVNDSGIGICLVGNMENHRPTTRQRRSLNELIGFLKDGYTRSNAEVTVHKWVDQNHTVCPGRRFVYDDLKRYA